VHFLSQVFDWFTTSSNWSGAQGIPELFWHQLELSLTVVLSALSSGAALGVDPRPHRPGWAGRRQCRQCLSGGTDPGPPHPAGHPTVHLAQVGRVPRAWIALTALAIPPILTNTYVGMREVDADVRDAAKAMGLTGGQVLRRVEAPLAVPFVMAGVRTAAIEVVATSTLAAYVSFTDLGTYVITGLNTNNSVLSFSGAILVAVMAGLVAGALSLLTRALTPLPMRRSTPRLVTARPGLAATDKLTNPDRISQYLRPRDGFMTVRLASRRGGVFPPLQLGKVSPMRFKRSLFFAGVLAAVFAAVAAPGVAFASVSASSKPTIIIGSTNFEEQAIVSNIWADVLKKAGYQVTVEPALGTRAIVVPAIEKGQINLEPDYAASLLDFLHNGATPAAGDNIATAIPADKKVLASHGVTVLPASKALDTNVFAVTKATARKDHLTTISSLKPYASKMTLGGPARMPEQRRM
jgi:osmoprotectant transport system permease protein